VTFYGLSPLAALLLALGTLGVLTAAHLLHRRYQRVTVPTLRFWAAALKRQHQDTLGGRWRAPLTWLLLCTLAGLLILGMLQPALSGRRGPTPYVVIVDCRASMMLPGESGTTRLEQAQSMGRDVLQEMAGPTGITLVAVHETAHVLTGPQDPKTEALHQLRHLTYTVETTDQGMDQALELAATLVKRSPRTEVVVLTDHALTAYDLCEPLQSQCHVLDLGHPVENVAILPPHIAPLPDGTYRLEVSLAHWGDQPCDGKLMLVQDEELRSSQRVSLAAGQVQSYDFVVNADEIAQTSVYMLCDEAFTQDNRTPSIDWQRRRVFLPSPAPFPLKAALTANPAYQIVDAADEAEVCVTLATAESANSTGYPAVRITPALCPDTAQRRNWMVDLFTGPNPSPATVDGPGTVLMQTADGQPLAVRTESDPTVVTLSLALFDEQATFWKQAQFLPILDAILQPAQPPGRSPHAITCYSDLSQPAETAQEVGQLSGPQAGASLTQWVLWLALAVALGERLCYYRGKIV